MSSYSKLKAAYDTLWMKHQHALSELERAKRNNDEVWALIGKAQAERTAAVGFCAQLFDLLTVIGVRVHPPEVLKGLGVTDTYSPRERAELLRELFKPTAGRIKTKAKITD